MKAHEPGAYFFFLGEAFFAVFLAAVFLAAAGFLAAVFLAAGFLAGDFLAAAFLGAVFFTAVAFLAGLFFAAFLGGMPPKPICEDEDRAYAGGGQRARGTAQTTQHGYVRQLAAHTLQRLKTTGAEGLRRAAPALYAWNAPW